MAEEAHKINPALRLLAILNKANQVPNTNNVGSPIYTRDAWCRVFDIAEPNSEAALLEVLSRLLALRKLFEDTENALLTLPNINEELFVNPVRNMAQIVDLNGLSQGWASYSCYLNLENLTRFEYSVHFLTQTDVAIENEVPKEELRELLVEIDGLTESILASSLPSDLKASLITLLQDIRKTVLEYRISGAAVFKEALQKSVGVLAVNKEALDQNKDSADIQALGKMLIRIDKMYTFAMKMKPLLEAAANVLPALSNHVK